jgi:putative tryptophan/tyrosine transport system substrate-binding protein
MRTLLGALCAALALIAGIAGAQPAPPRVIWVSPTASGQGGPFFEELRRGLREIGHVEGRSIQLQSAWGDGTPQRGAKLIAEVIATAPSIIVTQGSMGPLAGKATATIPVVFGYSGDPVEAGMVDSLPRPGRNLTGISYLTLELVGKRMELLKEFMPQAKRIAVVASPDHPGDSAERRASQAAAPRLGIDIDYFEIGRGKTVADVLAAIENTRSDAVMFFPTQTVIANRTLIAEWSLKKKLPTVSGWAQFADGGNLLSYGPNLADASRRLAFYVDRILKGAKPGDLPVELPTRVELVVNQKTARALGVTVPPSILLRADRVIE